jgi:hypothetical protein
MKKFITLICLSVAVNNWGFAQQTCSTPQIVSAGTVTIPVIDGIEVPALVCATGGSGSTAANWYKYTPAQNYSVIVTTNFVSNGNVDNRVHVFSGTCSSLDCVAGDDDSGINTLCIVTFDAIANTDYYIVFDNLYSSVGFMFELIENPPDFACQDLEKKKNKIFVRFISWGAVLRKLGYLIKDMCKIFGIKH